MKVQYFGRIPGVGYGNIIWSPAHPMKYGKLPLSHPCHENPEPLMILGCSAKESSDPLSKFRALGYSASCFPEGDGIVFDPPEGKESAEVIYDIIQCFGFEIQVCRD